MKNSAATVPSPGKFILNCLIASIFGVASVLILSLIASVILNSVTKPEGLYKIVSIAVYIISSILCGIVTKRKNGYSALFCGLASGGMLIALMFVLSLAIPVQPQAPLWQIIILPAGAVLGAMFGK